MIKKILKSFLIKILNKRGFELIPIEGSIDYQRKVLIDFFEIEKIIDVGVNEGQYSKLIRKSYDIPIIAFDPDPRVNKLIKTLKIKNHQFFNVGLGQFNSKQIFNLWPIIGGSSSFKKLTSEGEIWTGFNNKEIPTVEVLVKKLDDYINSDDKNLLLKIDVQGFEMEVLRGGVKSLNKINVIEIEVPAKEIYKGSDNIIEIHEFLTEHDFELSSFHSSRFHKIGVADFDCFYTKKGFNKIS
jgi:FkbM family methyltransferase